MADLAAFPPAAPPISGSPPSSSLYVKAVLALLAALMAAKAVAFSQPGEPVDFHCFHLVGRLVAAGRAGEAYGFRTLYEAMVAAYADKTFLPWSYPPQFAAVMAIFAPLPIGVAYLLFVAPALAAFVWMLRRAAGRDGFTTALLVCAPAMLVNVICGQNGLLTGALAGFAALGLAAGRAGAGWPLGLMVIKPHLAGALAVHALFTGRWGVVARAAATVALTSLAATALLTPAIWVAFLQGVREASRFLEAGFYPLHRMVSIYAVLRTAGAAPLVGLAVQVALAAAVLTAAALLARRRGGRTAAGFTLMAGVLVSPYAYDYDTTLFAAGLVFLLPELELRAGLREQAAIYALTLFAGLYGVACTMIMKPLGLDHEPEHPVFAAGGVALAAAALMTWRVLQRAPVENA